MLIQEKHYIFSIYPFDTSIFNSHDTYVLILNAAQCVGDTKAGKVKNERIAQAYLWMLVQPYTSLDGLSFAILSDKDKQLIYKVADETPATIEKLGKILRMDKERTKELPALFMKIIVTTF